MSPTRLPGTPPTTLHGTWTTRETAYRRLGFTVMEPLARLLEEAHDGRIQVPEFQRELILTDEWMKSLLASVSLGISDRSWMLLEAGSREMRFENPPIGHVAGHAAAALRSAGAAGDRRTLAAPICAA